MDSTSPNFSLYLKPAWDIADGRFPEQWSRFLGSRQNIWNNHLVHHEKVFDDQSIGLTTNDLMKTLSLAEDIKKNLREQTGKENVPFRLVIDTISDLEIDTINTDIVDLPWGDLEMGTIYISSRIQNMIESGWDLPITISPAPPSCAGLIGKLDNQLGSVCEATLDSMEELISGSYPTCFYCGSKKHPVSDCPSKKLADPPKFIDRLGYFSFDTINKVLGAFVRTGGLNAQYCVAEVEEEDSEVLWARDGFFGVKRIYQLPFFRQIWDSKDESWESIKRQVSKREEKGGNVWIGTDCLRVSNLSQAELLLKQEAEKNGNDYRTHCALGFVYIEKNDFLAARLSLMKALGRAETKPQKIYVNLISCRLYDIEKYPLEAAEKVRDILKIEKNCPEAFYQDVILQFRDGKLSEALSRLKKLIAKDRQFFINALIDPDLAPFRKEIHPALAGMLDQVKSISRETSKEAKNVYKKAKALLGHNGMEDADALWQRVIEISENDGLFAHMDVIGFGNTLIATCEKSIQVRKKALFDHLYQLHREAGKYTRFIQEYVFPSLIQGLYKRIMLVEKGIAETKSMVNSDNPEIFSKSFDQPQHLKAELVKIESKLRKLDIIQVNVLFLYVFFKMLMIVQSIVAVFAVVAFPVIVHYLKIVFPEREMGLMVNVWGYQKGIFIIGGVIAIGFSVYKAVKAIHHRHRILGKHSVGSNDPSFSFEKEASIS